MIEKLNVVVRDKENVFIESECLSVSMDNELGPFDILPEHANFVAAIYGDVTVRKISGELWKKHCPRGLVRVANNVVDVVFLDELRTE